MRTRRPGLSDEQIEDRKWLFGMRAWETEEGSVFNRSRSTVYLSSSIQLTLIKCQATEKGPTSPQQLSKRTESVGDVAKKQEVSRAILYGLGSF